MSGICRTIVVGGIKGGVKRGTRRVSDGKQGHVACRHVQRPNERERTEEYRGYLSGILSDRMSGLCRYFVGPYVGIASGLCRYCVGTMSGVMSDYTGVMSGPRASQGGVMCLRKGHLDPAWPTSVDARGS